MKKALEKSYKILVANGVNLDLLGQREQHHYGSETLAELETYLRSKAQSMNKIFNSAKIDLHFFQSNDEAEFLNEISKTWDGAIINPGAWTHTSLALADRLAAVKLKFIEVHLSKLAQREDFRRHSYCASHALGIISGLGFDSYLSGLFALIQHFEKGA